ncbi:hypothetical protein [Streptomyces sp. NPDC096324]|uniref:hypothetical protein n=1 Tax=Streptomyces sp. NPDC096324 TaxID=3366085 RepID=UPI0037F75C06
MPPPPRAPAGFFRVRRRCGPRSARTKGHTSGDFAFKVFPGGHFHLLGQAGQVAEGLLAGTAAS